jgi:hypothetical protein
MVLLHGICGKITMHFMKRYFHGLKGTTQLSFGNLSKTANISMSISNSVERCVKGIDCFKDAIFVHFMSERTQLFDLELKISFRFDIETKTSHHFMFRFDIETKRCVFFKLCCALKKNNTATFNKTVLDSQKRT